MTVDVLGAGALGAPGFIAVAHTALGPDHYVPFIVLSRANRWSTTRTLAVTAGCGVGHLLSSLLLGVFGLVGGAALGSLATLEVVRGGLAGWALCAFGVAYLLWGLQRGMQPHHHAHEHGTESGITTSWALFLIFVLGPCEPLIPLFLVPASQGRWALAGAMALVFAIATLVTMLVVTLLALRGIERLPLVRMERWMHALSGGAIALSGVAVLLGA